MIIHLIAGLIKKYLVQYCIKMSQYFPKPYEAFSEDMNVKVDLSNYATKTDIKNISHVVTSSFAFKKKLANLKAEVDKLDIDKLVSVPVDLSKLSDLVKNDVVKKDVYNKLVAKVNAIDPSKFISKTRYDTDKSELENKIPDTSGLVKKTDYNTKITEIEGKILDISSLATKTAKKADYSSKVTEIQNIFNNRNHDKYIDTEKFNKLAGGVFNARLAQANLVTETGFDDKLSNLNKKITKNKSDHLLVQNKSKKLETFDLSYFIGKNYFEEDRYTKLFSISTNNQIF